MNKQELLHDLRDAVYCRLRPSAIHGVGVFAIRDIPAGINPFESSHTVELIPVDASELSGIHPAVKDYLSDMCIIRGTTYMVPDCGLNGIDIAYFLNHSEHPNLSVESTDRGDVEFITSREIKAGEELTVSYTYTDR